MPRSRLPGSLAKIRYVSTLVTACRQPPPIASGGGKARAKGTAAASRQRLTACSDERAHIAYFC